MFLSQLLFKTIYTGKTPRGITVGIGFSRKNHAINHLLCALHTPNPKETPTVDFTVNTSSVLAINDGISLRRIHPVLPKTQTKLFPNLPVYSNDGVFLGNIIDGEVQNFVLHRLFTDLGNDFSPEEIHACRDAIFLRKSQPYPLGQRIPSLLAPKLQSNEKSVTKPLLRRALQKGALIKLTLSLPPFALFSNTQD